MKLFKISTNFKYALADITESYNGADSLSITSETPEALKNFQYSWLTQDSTIIPNIAIIMSELFCLDDIALEALKTSIPDLIQTPMLIGEERFFSLSNIPILKGSMNLKSSKIKYFSTGDIMEIIEPIFNKGDYPNFFKCEEVIGSFFCSEDFMNIVIDNNLTGIVFEECKVKSKSWFSL